MGKEIIVIVFSESFCLFGTFDLTKYYWPTDFHIHHDNHTCTYYYTDHMCIGESAKNSKIWNPWSGWYYIFILSNFRFNARIKMLLLHANNNGADQPVHPCKNKNVFVVCKLIAKDRPACAVHPCSLISLIVIPSLKSTIPKLSSLSEHSGFNLNPFHSGSGKQVLWQTVKTQMKCCIVPHFIRVCTVYYSQPSLQWLCMSPNNLMLNWISFVILKFKLNWYICANTTEVINNFAVIKCQYKEFSLYWR